MLRPDLVSVSSNVIELLGSFVFRSGGEDSEENNDHSPEARPLEEVAKSRLVSNGVDAMAAGFQDSQPFPHVLALAYSRSSGEGG